MWLWGCVKATGCLGRVSDIWGDNTECEQEGEGLEQFAFALMKIFELDFS
jgi:hypothetical protein